MTKRIRLGVNIDHVATIRNARGGGHPDPSFAAQIATEAGADGITFHLREDRRHITDSDLAEIRARTTLPLNMEMAATEEMLEKALNFKPETVTLVPEKREERTTEGGLNVAGEFEKLAPFVEKLQDNGTKVSVFIEAEKQQLDAAKALNVEALELHAGRYAELLAEEKINQSAEVLIALQEMAEYAESLGIEALAGHGLNYISAANVARIPQITELNIGHFLIGEAIYVGLSETILRMRKILDEVR